MNFVFATGMKNDEASDDSDGSHGVWMVWIVLGISIDWGKEIATNGQGSHKFLADPDSPWTFYNRTDLWLFAAKWQGRMNSFCKTELLHDLAPWIASDLKTL